MIFGRIGTPQHLLKIQDEVLGPRLGTPRVANFNLRPRKFLVNSEIFLVPVLSGNSLQLQDYIHSPVHGP